MTISPYDSLPMGKKERDAEKTEHQERSLNPQEASDPTQRIQQREQHAVRPAATGMQAAQEASGPNAAPQQQSQQDARQEKPRPSAPQQQTSQHAAQQQTQESQQRDPQRQAQESQQRSPQQPAQREPQQETESAGQTESAQQTLQYVEVPIEDAEAAAPQENAQQPATGSTAPQQRSAIGGASSEPTLPEQQTERKAAQTSEQQMEQQDSQWEPLESQNAEPQISSSQRLRNPQQPSQMQTAETETQSHTTPSVPTKHTGHPDLAKTTPPEKAPQYTKLSIKNRWGTEEYIMPFEESLLVPDTMPDMAEILFAEGRVNPAQPGKNSYEASDFVSGDITFYTVYRPDAPEDAPIDVVKSAIPFKTDKCWGNAENGSFRVTISLKSASAERVNERKFIARGELSIRFTRIVPKELMVLKDMGDPEMVQLQDTLKATDLDFEAEEITEISQQINIRDDKPLPVKILKETIEIVENHKQITSGKLVINATINSQILYLGDEAGEKKICSLSNKTDFTQFVPVKDNADASMIQIGFVGSDLKITIEGDDEFLLQGQVRTTIQGYISRELPMISDAYHKTRSIRFDIKEEPLSSVKGTVSGEISAREVINLNDSDKKPAALLCGSGSLSAIKGRPEGGRVIIEGSVPVKILALDENDLPFLIESTVPLRGSLEMPAAGDALTIDVSAAVKEFWFDEINSRQIEVNVSATIDVWINGVETFKTLENLCFVEESEPQKRIAMAVYVVGSGDTLWDVAKKYKSETASIAALNQIDPQRPLPVGMKLLIMK